MSATDNDITRLVAAETKLSGDIATIRTGVAGLQAQTTANTATIADLKAQLASAGLSQAQADALDAAVTAAEGLAASADTLAGEFGPPVPPMPPTP